MGISDCRKSPVRTGLFCINIVKYYWVTEMIIKNEDKRRNVVIVDIETLVPENHLLRKIDSCINWNKIYEFVEDLYSPNMGRPSVDPVVLVKMVFLQHLYGLRSLRQTAENVSVNIAFRWFLGYDLIDKTPHFSTLSYNFKHRFSSEVFEKIFTWVLEEAINGGYVQPEVIFVDSTHIKANANSKKQMKKYIPAAVKAYEEQLYKEINEDRENHGRKTLNNESKRNEEQREVTASTTDPDSGLFHKGEHKKCFAYSAHTVCDQNNFILEVEVTPGNIHDSIVFDTVYDRVTSRLPDVKVVTVDAGYKTPWICKKIFDDNRIPSMPYKRPMTRKGNHPWQEYVYDEYYDCIICPEYQILNYATTNRNGYREYKSNPDICKNCPTRKKCTISRNCQKTVTRHIWHEYIERAEDVRHSPLGKETYSMRSQTIERVFADAKEKHGMRYTTFRGLAQVRNWVRLKFAAMNLKKLALRGHVCPLFYRFWAIFLIFQRKQAFSPT
jgi:transposase